MSVSVSDLWHDMVSCKSHVSELENWKPIHSKNKKKLSVRVELRSGGDPYRSEKPRWSASDMRQWPKQKMHRHPVSPTRFLLLDFSICSKLAK